jgi:hypothetical protein
MKLEIVLRIHDGKNIHGDNNTFRYINIEKKDLIIGCVSSLINSANNTENIDIFFTILNDNCSKKCISKIYEVFSYSKYPYKIINLKIPGFHYSGLKQFEYCKNSSADLVYSVEDDYLHHPNSIKEMIQSYIFLKKNYLKNEKICLFPLDNTELYLFDLYPGRLFKTPSIHWKEGYHTTFTMMCSPMIFKEYWTTFETLALKYEPRNLKLLSYNPINEKNTIGNIWEHCVVRLNSIPSLALHIQFELQKDHHINHLEWWNKYSKIKNFSINY